jgi:hypothetical protein
MMALAGLWLAVRRMPRWLWPAAGIAIAALLLWRWHDRRVDAAVRSAVSAQKAADQAAVARATATAMAAQHRLAASLAATQAHINQDTRHALDASDRDLARRYDDRRLRWAAARAAASRPGQDGTAAVSNAAGPADFSACAAQGWVDFDTAAAAARAADAAVAKDDAWIAWAKAQAAAWPDSH